jgi:hypothetical protein
MKMRNSGIVMEVTRQMTIATRQEEQEWMTLSKKYQRERERQALYNNNKLIVPPFYRQFHHHGSFT